MSDTEKRWTDDVAKHLLGHTITRVRYMADVEREHLGITAKAIVLELDDGNIIWPMRDDEGNDAGAMFTTIKDLPTIPVIW